MTTYDAAIRLQFVTEAGIDSAFIRWFGGDLGFSHVDAVLDDGNLLGARDDAVGGQPPGVRIRPPGYANFTRQEIVDIPCTAAEKAAFIAAIARQVGKRYSELSILGFALGRDLDDRTNWFCDELQLWGLYSAGLASKAIAALKRRITPDGFYLVALQIVDCRTR